MAHLFKSQYLSHPTCGETGGSTGLGRGRSKNSVMAYGKGSHVWSAGEQSELEIQMRAFSENREHQCGS